MSKEDKQNGPEKHGGISQFIDRLRDALVPKVPGKHWEDFAPGGKKERGRFDVDYGFTLGPQNERSITELSQERDLATNHRLAGVPRMRKGMMFWATVGKFSDGGQTVHLERLVKSAPQYAYWHNWQIVLEQNSLIGEKVFMCIRHSPTGRPADAEWGGSVQKFTVRFNGPWTIELDRPAQIESNVILAYNDKRFGPRILT